MEIGEIGDVVLFCFGCLVCICPLRFGRCILGSFPTNRLCHGHGLSFDEGKLLPSLSQTITFISAMTRRVRAFFWNFPSQSLKHRRTCLHVGSVANTASITYDDPVISHGPDEPEFLPVSSKEDRSRALI
jgi:hypothetical protein